MVRTFRNLACCIEYSFARFCKLLWWAQSEERRHPPRPRALAAGTPLGSLSSLQGCAPGPHGCRSWVLPWGLAPLPGHLYSVLCSWGSCGR